MPTEDETRLRVLGLLATGKSAKEVAREEVVSYTKVLKWRREYASADVKEDIQTIIETEPAVIHEIAEGIKEKLETLDTVSGELVDNVVKDINKLMQLEGDMQQAGIKLVKRISDMVDDCTAPIELETLVASLARLQVAFFSKGASVNVLNAPGASFSDSGVSTFKSMQRSS